MKSSLQYEVAVPNDAREELEIDCSLTSQGEERYSLRYPAWKDNGASYPSETIHLTGAEVDQLAYIVEKFRQMKQSAREAA